MQGSTLADTALFLVMPKSAVNSVANSCCTTHHAEPRVICSMFDWRSLEGRAGIAVPALTNIAALQHAGSFNTHSAFGIGSTYM